MLYNQSQEQEEGRTKSEPLPRVDSAWVAGNKSFNLPSRKFQTRATQTATL